MRIYAVDNKDKKLEKLNNGRNEVIDTSIFSAILSTLWSKGSIIYSSKQNSILDVLQKVFKIPYLYGDIKEIVEFENHYAKIKKYEIPVLMYHQFVNEKSDGGKIKLFVTKKQFVLTYCPNI